MESEEQNYPQQWICPIRQQLMKDPVIADDGFSYEREGIVNWFKNSTISPITGLHLTSTKLIPNRALKNTIDQFLEKLNEIPSQEQKSKQNPIQQNNQKSINAKLLKKNQIEESIQMKATSIFNQDEQSYILNLQIVPPQKMSRNKRKPISLVCIVDTSDSMNIDAVKDSKDKESHGFSRLDLVRHSINTLIHFMDDLDELTLIIFNTAAQCILNTTKMNNAGKKSALKKIKDLQASGTTNIWQGLRISLEMLKKINHKDKNVFTILLTDGEPNLNPPRGIIPTLKKYIEVEELHTPNFHVFGYGYELDTKLLEQIARKGAGTFAYIPDCSMVGTVFINFMANCLTTISNRAILTVEYPTGSKNQEIYGFHPFKSNQYNLGCIQYGQKRDIHIPISKNCLNEGTIKFTLKYGSIFEEQNVVEISSNLEEIKINDTENIRIRFKYLQLLSNCIRYGTKFELALTDIKFFYHSLEKLQPNSYIETLLRELKCDNDENLGQVEKAFLKEQWYKKWGKTYIPSLLLAHLMQVCTNFKDPLLQIYGGDLFQEYQNQMDTIFIKMQPPKPSAKKEKNIVYKPAPVDMSHYYRNYGGCIDGQCIVDIWKLNACGQYETKQQKLKNVKKGDLIGKNRVKVECMVETRIFGFVDMVKLGDLIITPWHPIIHNSKWTFPINIKFSQKIFVERYYNFVTQGNKPLEIENVECISLGHQIKNDPVTNHQYLSSEKVIQDLKSSQENYQKGLVVIRSVERDYHSSQISRFVAY